MDRWCQFNTIIDDENLDIKEKGLLLILFRYVNYEKGYADPSRALIKKLTRISDNRTLDNILRQLTEKGYLQLVKKASKGNAPIYKILTYDKAIHEEM